MPKNSVKNTTRPLNPQPSLNSSRTSPPPEQGDIHKQQSRLKQAAAGTAAAMKTQAPAVRVEFAPTPAKESLSSSRSSLAPPRGEANLSRGSAPQTAPITTSAPKIPVGMRTTTPKAVPSALPTQPGKPEVFAQPQKPTGPKTISVNFALLRRDAKQVWLAGDFNGWSGRGTPMKQRNDGRWEGTVALVPGRYEYKFVVDGEWIADPASKQNVTNAFGSLNSVLEVRA